MKIGEYDPGGKVRQPRSIPLLTRESLAQESKAPIRVNNLVLIRFTALPTYISRICRLQKLQHLQLTSEPLLCPTPRRILFIVPFRAGDQPKGPSKGELKKAAKEAEKAKKAAERAAKEAEEKARREAADVVS